MITVYIPNNFITERKYAVQTMLQHYCGIEVDVVPRAGQIHYEISWEGKSITIRDQFFGHTVVGQTYLAANRIPKKIIEAKKEGFDQILILFGEDEITITPEHIDSNVDLFAGAFFMLTRWEESLGMAEDVHARFPADAALVVQSGFILRPIVDEYVALLKKWLRQLGFSFSEKQDQFKVVPTGDVDIPYYWLKKPRWKTFVSEWMKEKRLETIKETIQNIRGVNQGWLKDPYDEFEYMMSTAEKAGLSFEFNMLVGGISKFEGFYSLKDARIQALLKTFKERGHRIGLHPSYNSFVDFKLIVEEKKLLSKYTTTVVESSRQHYLRFATPTTWRFLADAGIKEDSTMGYAADPGFRCGTSKPFPVFDVQEKRTLHIIERPLLIMDVSFRFYKKYSPEESIALSEKIIHEVKKHNGELVFLWHNSNLSEVDGWENWRDVFEFLMNGK